MFFRDRTLSDLIGFEYHKWNEHDAVADFVGRLRLQAQKAGDEGLTVIALDGENPWAAYRHNGVPFLRELFDRLLREPGLEPMTLSDHLRRAPEAKEIRPAAGTWLGNFSKWIGHEAKNNAWEELSRARKEAGPVEEILIAEGSDWFWWYGEPGTEVFDALFRGYLRKARLRAARPQNGER